MRGLSRERQGLYRFSSVLVLAETGADFARSFFVTPPDVGATLLSLAFDPEIAYSASGSNFWTISLFTHARNGNDAITIPGSVYVLDVEDLSIDGVLTLPRLGEFGWSVPPDRVVHLAVEETGTGTSTLQGMAHLAWKLGG